MVLGEVDVQLILILGYEQASRNTIRPGFKNGNCTDWQFARRDSLIHATISDASCMMALIHFTSCPACTRVIREFLLWPCAATGRRFVHYTQHVPLLVACSRMVIIKSVDIQPVDENGADRMGRTWHLLSPFCGAPSTLMACWRCMVAILVFRYSLVEECGSQGTSETLNICKRRPTAISSSPSCVLQGRRQACCGHGYHSSDWRQISLIRFCLEELRIPAAEVLISRGPLVVNTLALAKRRDIFSVSRSYYRTQRRKSAQEPMES